LATAGTAVREPGDQFALAGSLTEAAMLRRAPVAVDDCTPILARQLATRAAEHRARPRRAARRARRFSGLAHRHAPAGRGASLAREDERRLRVIADYAALALHKERLLEDVQAASQAKSNFWRPSRTSCRTPLTALTGYGELLADEIIGPLSAPQHEVVERMRSVTQQLRDDDRRDPHFSSIEAGRERIHATRVLAGDLVRAAVTVVEPLARHKGIVLAVAAPEAPIALHTDGDKVRQILVNLAGNAVKFTDRGRVDVGVENGNGSVRFRVRDTGVGIAPEDQIRLFHRSARWTPD
jgi:signal transduction histidine kinase